MIPTIESGKPRRTRDPLPLVKDTDGEWKGVIEPGTPQFRAVRENLGAWVGENAKSGQ